MLNLLALPQIATTHTNAPRWENQAANDAQTALDAATGAYTYSDIADEDAAVLNAFAAGLPVDADALDRAIDNTDAPLEGMYVYALSA